MWFDPHEIEQVIEKVINRFLLPRFHELGMEATGEWRHNLEIELGDDSATIKGRNYSEQLARGRKPGTLPPITPIKRWVQAKFGYGEEESESIAWAVAQKIKREGTTWYKKGGTNLIEILSEPETIEFVQNELEGILKVKIQENLIRNTQQIFS